jgi:hypothetical protein
MKMHNQPFKLSDLIALQAENAAAPPRLKSVTEIKKPTLDQIDMLPFKKRGGKRSGAGRPRSTASVTIRIPANLLNVVTEIKNGTHQPDESTDLKSVTEIKDDTTAAQAIHALREYFRAEYMMGADDIAFEMWIKHTLETTQ